MVVDGILGIFQQHEQDVCLTIGQVQLQRYRRTIFARTLPNQSIASTREQIQAHAVKLDFSVLVQVSNTGDGECDHQVVNSGGHRVVLLD